MADGGHILSTPLQKGAGPAIAREDLARWAQAAVATLQIVALVGTGPGQLEALVDIWKGAGSGRVAQGLPQTPGRQQPLSLSDLPQNPAASWAVCRPAPELPPHPLGPPRLLSTQPILLSETPPPPL